MRKKFGDKAYRVQPEESKRICVLSTIVETGILRTNKDINTTCSGIETADLRSRNQFFDWRSTAHARLRTRRAHAIIPLDKRKSTGHRIHYLGYNIFLRDSSGESAVKDPRSCSTAINAGSIIVYFSSLETIPRRVNDNGHWFSFSFVFSFARRNVLCP